MLPACKECGIAAITYQAIFDTDLTGLTRSDLDPDVKTSARSSMFRFAWEIKGGDEILVGDSETKRIVARGYVTSPPGKRAYRFNAKNPIREPVKPNVPWRHEVPVHWDDDFESFPYRDGAPQHTVMPFDPSWAPGINATPIAQPTTGESENEGDRQVLNESAYLRQTRASLRNVERLHAALSNRFREWVRTRFSAKAIQERDQVDVTFVHEGITHLAELKICYGANTKAAIREALGQLLEYNNYPRRTQAQSWWLVLDQRPGRDDCQFIAALRENYAFPLRIAWSVADDFDSIPKALDR